MVMLLRLRNNILVTDWNSWDGKEANTGIVGDVPNTMLESLQRFLLELFTMLP